MCVYEFTVDYRPFDTSNTIHIHRYLMKNNEIKCLVLLKKNFIRLLTGRVSASNCTKCMSLSYQK